MPRYQSCAFSRNGLSRELERYTDPDNSFINRVLETKRGLPITLSVLYLLIGQRLGTPIEPISSPGHFVIGCFDEQAPFYIDPFERGKFLTAGQMLKRVEAITLAPNIGHLAPASTHETLAGSAETSLNTTLDNRDSSMAELFRFPPRIQGSLRKTGLTIRSYLMVEPPSYRSW